MITLHESNITSFPQDNGIGVLKDVIRAYAEEELNGMFEFYMEYDSEGFLVDELKEERIIKAKAQDKLGYQLFRIYSITKNHENDNIIVNAQHITYDLANNFVEKMEARSLTKKQVMEKIGASTVIPHPFNVTSSNTTTVSSTNLYRTNPLQMIGGMDGSVLQIWGGQIERDNFHLILHDRRGSDDGVKVTYEKNITGLEATFDISGLVTRIFPFVFIEGSDNEPDRLITVNGKYIDSPHINDYEKIYIKPIDYSHDERINTDGTDAQIRQQLTNIASQYFTETGNDKIKVDMEVQFEHLWETEEYKDLAVLELVGMGDTVTIEHSRLKVNATAIVNYIRYDCIAEKNEEVRLGSVKARLTDSVNKVVDVAEKAERAEQTANQAIRTANGKNTIYYGPDEPEGGIEGDLWFRVVDGEYTRTYRHDGIQWQLVLSVDVRDAIDEAQQAKDEAQEAVERANQATQQATDAINQAQTAFDEAQQALSTAGNALTQANSAFTTASEAFAEVTALSTMVDENTGEISTIKQSVIGLQTRVSDNEGNLSNLTQIAQGLQSQVSDIEGNVSTLQQTAQGLQSSVTNLQNELDGLEIGGRNLLRNSDFSKGLEHWQSNGSISLVNVDGKKAIKLTGTTNGFYQYPTNLEENTYYTISLKAKSVGETSSLRFGFLNQGAGLERTINVDSTWRKYTFTTTQFIDFNLNTFFHFYATSETAEGVYITEIKLEKGNKATDWTPAPEDIDHQFSVITQTIDSITARIGDAEGNITVLQQTSSSLAARLTDAEGNITTITATVSGLQTTVSNIEGDVSSVTQLANALQTRMTNAEGDISTLTQTASSLQSVIEGMGTENNIIPNGSFENGELGWILHSRATIYIGDSKHGSNSLRIVGGSGRISQRLTLNTVPVEPGHTYKIEYWVKTSSDFNGVSENNKLRLGYSSNETSAVHYSVGWTGPLTEWTKMESIWTVPNDVTRITPTIVSNHTQGWVLWDNIVVRDINDIKDMATQSQITQLSDAINLRVMKGDVINQINISDESILIDGRKVHITGQTTIDNGVIKSAHIQSLDAGKITTGTLDAGKISVINLSANSIVGGILQSQTNNTTFNLNSGELTMQNVDFILGGGANIEFTSSGNKLFYDRNNRKAGLLVGNSINNTYPFIGLGATNLNQPLAATNEAGFSGFIANTFARESEDGIQNSVVGRKFHIRDAVTGFSKGFEFDLNGNTITMRGMSTGSYDYQIGDDNAPIQRIIVSTIRTDNFMTIRNRFNTDIGWRIETQYPGDGSGIGIRGINAGAYNYVLGKSDNRLQAIFLRTNPNVSSDQRLKEDIQDLDLGLDFIKRVEVKQFRQKLTTADINQGITQNPIQYGIIAQQVNSVLADFGVTENSLINKGDDGYYGAQYEQFIPTLIKSDQELDLKIEAVKDDVEWLKIENQYLRQKIEQLEEMIA